jgi:PAS domain S-box-containing protein
LQYRYVSRAFAEMLGRTPEEIAGRPIISVVGEETLRTLLPHIEAVLRGQTVEFEDDVHLSDVGVRRLHVMYVPDKDEHGQVIGWMGNIVDLTELRQAEALRVANIELLEADRRKTEFLAMLSHELRNPLAPIRNSTYILRYAAPGSEQASRAQQVIERQTNHLTRLVDDLLDVTRIARGKIELRREQLDLREVVRRAAEDFRLPMDAGGIAFRADLPAAKLLVQADPTRVTQIIGNLLHNASKFTRRGDEIVLSLEATGGYAEISVRDTGAGIDPSLLTRVFEPFVQADQSLARTQGGLGLGLALVKGIAEMHGGSVHAESAGRGHGTEFVVRLPAADAAAVRPDLRPATQPSTRVRHILVVDDNDDAAETLALLLSMIGRGSGGAGRSDRRGVGAGAGAGHRPVRSRHAGHGRLRGRAPASQARAAGPPAHRAERVRAARGRRPGYRSGLRRPRRQAAGPGGARPPAQVARPALLTANDRRRPRPRGAGTRDTASGARALNSFQAVLRSQGPEAPGRTTWRARRRRPP